LIFDTLLRVWDAETHRHFNQLKARTIPLT
jgi:hypothetical protein